MASRSHRWNGTPPLSGFHGGTKKAAHEAIELARGPKVFVPSRKLAERERAVSIAKAQLDQLLSKLPPIPTPRKDKVRPKVTLVRRTQAEIKAERKEWLAVHMETQGGRCAYCSRMMRSKAHRTTPDLCPSVDHVVPLSRGGADSLENTVAACVTCNGEKADMMPEVYRQILRDRYGLPPLPHPRRN